MKTILSFFLIFSTILTYAQVNPLERAIVTTADDEVIEGQVYWESESKLSNAFELHKGHVKKTFTPDKVKSLMLLNDSVVYEPVTYTWISRKKKMTGQYLARLIAKGPLSLYRLELDAAHYDVYEGFSYVFILRKDNQDYTLLHAPKSYSYGYDKYKGVLRYVLKDEVLKQREIERTSYTENSLVALIKTLGNTDQQPEIKAYTQKSASIFSHQLRLGYSYSPGFTQDGIRFKNGMGLGLGYGLDITTPRISKRYFTTVEIVYFYQKWPTGNYQDQYGFIRPFDLVRNGLRLSIIGNYQFTYSKVRPLFLFGVSGDISIPFTLLPNFLIGGGVKMNRFTMSANYERPIDFLFGEPTGSFIHVKLGIGLYQSPKTKG